jgi:hypothetical protein
MKEPRMTQRNPRARKALHRTLPVALAAALGIACSSTATIAPAADDPTCGQTFCPSDTAPSASSVDACNQILNGGCAISYRAFLDCVQKDFVCDSSGHLDQGATLAACQSQYDTYNECVPGFDAGSFGG